MSRMMSVISSPAWVSLYSLLTGTSLASTRCSISPSASSSLSLSVRIFGVMRPSFAWTSENLIQSPPLLISNRMTMAHFLER